MPKRKPVVKKATKSTPAGKTPPLTYSQEARRDGGVELILESFTHERGRHEIGEVGGVVFRSVGFPQWVGDGVFYLQGKQDTLDHTRVVVPREDVKKVLAALKKYGAVRVPRGKKVSGPGSPPPLTYAKEITSGSVRLVLKSFTHKRKQGDIETREGIRFASALRPEWVPAVNTLFLQGEDLAADASIVLIPLEQWPRVEKALAEYGAVEVMPGRDEFSITEPSRVDLKPDPEKNPAPLGTCEGVLEMLDRMACALDSTERSKLWDVLTALRGPDTPDVGRKSVTTAVIRAKAFPLWMARGTNPGADTAGDYHPGEASRNEVCTTSSGHFQAHARRAFLALGLTW